MVKHNSSSSSEYLDDRLKNNDKLFLPIDHVYDWDEMHSHIKNRVDSRTAEEVAESYLLKLSGRLDQIYGRPKATEILNDYSNNETGTLDLENLKRGFSTVLNEKDLEKIFPNEEKDEFIASSYIYGRSLEERLISTDGYDRIEPIDKEVNYLNFKKPLEDILNELDSKLSEVESIFGKEFRTNLFNTHIDEKDKINLKELHNSLEFLVRPDSSQNMQLSPSRKEVQEGVSAVVSDTPSSHSSEDMHSDSNDFETKAPENRAVHLTTPNISLSELYDSEFVQDEYLQQVHSINNKTIIPEYNVDFSNSNTNFGKLKKLNENNNSEVKELNDNISFEDDLLKREKLVKMANIDSTEENGPASGKFGVSVRNPATRGAKEWLAANPGADEATVKRGNLKTERDGDDSSKQSSLPSQPREALPSDSNKKEPSVLSRITAALSATAGGLQNGAQTIYHYVSSIMTAKPELKKPEVPDHARMPTSRKIDVDANASLFIDSNKRNTEPVAVEVGKLRIPGIFKGTQTINKDLSVTNERQVLGGAFKRTQVYAYKDDEMIKTSEKKTNLFRETTNEIKTQRDGSVVRNETRKNVLGFGDAVENNASGRLLTQKSNLAYKMNVQAHPQAELNPNVRQKTTAVLGMFKGTYDVGADNKAIQTGYSNPFNSNEKTKVAVGVTKTRVTDLGGLLSRTIEKAADGTEFVTKDRVRGFYKMQASQASAAEGKGGASDAKTTLEAGFLGIKAFKREVVIPHDSDMKTTSVKIFGVTVSKQITTLSDGEKSLRDAQVQASKLKSALPQAEKPKNFVERTTNELQKLANYVRNNPGTVATAGLSAAAVAISPNPLTVANLGVQAATVSHSYNSQGQGTAASKNATPEIGTTGKSQQKSSNGWGTEISKTTSTTFDAIKGVASNGISAVKNYLDSPANTTDKSSNRRNDAELFQPIDTKLHRTREAMMR